MSRRTSKTKRFMGLMTSTTALTTMATTAQSISQNPTLWMMAFALMVFGAFLLRG